MYGKYHADHRVTASYLSSRPKELRGFLASAPLSIVYHIEENHIGGKNKILSAAGVKIERKEYPNECFHVYHGDELLRKVTRRNKSFTSCAILPKILPDITRTANYQDRLREKVYHNVLQEVKKSKEKEPLLSDNILKCIFHQIDENFLLSYCRLAYDKYIVRWVDSFPGYPMRTAQTTILGNGSPVKYELRLEFGKKLFKNTTIENLKKGLSLAVTGEDSKQSGEQMLCEDPLRCLILIFEHEIIHALTFRSCNYKQNAHDDRFYESVASVFGHNGHLLEWISNPKP